MKKIVVLMGSPRRGGNTEALAREFIKGAEAAGNTVDVIYPAEMNIKGCTGCNACHKGSCVLRDDMTECYSRLASADVIAIATPIYFYGVSSQLKALIDRLHNPIRNSFAVRRLVLLAVCADTIDTVFDSVLTMYRSTISYFGLEDGGAVLVRGVSDKGDIEGNPLLKEAEKLGEGI